MLTRLPCADNLSLVMNKQDVTNIHIEMPYDEIWAELIKSPKDNRYIPVVGSDRVPKLQRRNLSRAMCARCERQKLPYKLHAVKTAELKFWWEERSVPKYATHIEKLQHKLDRERFDIDIKLGVHPALLK